MSLIGLKFREKDRPTSSIFFQDYSMQKKSLLVNQPNVNKPISTYL